MCYAVVGPTGRATHSNPMILPFSAFILLIKSENFEKMVQNQCLTNIWSFWYGTCSLDRLQCSFLGSWSWESLTLIFSILAHVRSWRLCVLLMSCKEVKLCTIFKFPIGHWTYFLLTKCWSYLQKNFLPSLGG